MEAGQLPPPPAPAHADGYPPQRRVLWRVAGLCGLAAIIALLALSLIAGSSGNRLANVMGISFFLGIGFALLNSLRRLLGAPWASATAHEAGTFRQIADDLWDAVVVAGSSHVYYANAAATRMLGIHAGPCTPALQALANAHEGTAPLKLHHPDGTPFQAALSVRQAVHDGQACLRFVVRDLSELEQGRAALATSNAELQAMAGRLFSLQEDERRSISRDLHDDIGQAITAMKLAAFAARDEDQAERRREDIDQIIELADSTVIRLRDLSMLLRPPQLDALGLEAALRWQAGTLFRSTPVELLLDVRTLSQRPGNEVEQACFRIAQEGLTNALRHARASQVSLLLQDAPDGGLHLRVIDDGEGFDPTGPRGLGMIVMRERAQSAGGKLHIETAPGEGTCIDLRLPCPARQP